MSIALTDLRPEADRDVVTTWLRDYLSEHVGWWSAAYGLGWDEARVAAHLAEHEEALVTRDWQSLVGAAANDSALVAVVRNATLAPIAIVQASVEDERFMCSPFGALDWIYVAPQGRGRGVAGAMLEAAMTWMRSRGCPGAHVFVTGPNEGAVKLYERAGFEVVDYRMMTPL